MKINDYTREERDRALDEAWEIMNPVEGNNLERIEDIKEQLVINVKLKIEDVNWLIEETGRAQKLKKEFADDIDFKRREVLGLQAENKRLREALKNIRITTNDDMAYKTASEALRTT